MRIFLLVLFFIATYGVWAQDGPKIKMDLDWGTTLGSESYDSAEAMTTDTEGNIYIVGSYSNIVDFDPSEEVYDMGASNCGGQYILKLDKYGDFIWARSFGAPSNFRTSLQGVCVDSEGSIILTGRFLGEVDFNLNEGTHLVSSNKEDLFILKIDKHTNFEWVYTIPSARIASGFSVLTDKNDDILFAGFGDVNSSSIERYMVFGKISTDGDLHWSHWVKNSSFENPHKMCLDDEDNLYIATHFSGTATFTSQKNSITLQAENAKDGLIL